MNTNSREIIGIPEPSNKATYVCVQIDKKTNREVILWDYNSEQKAKEFVNACSIAELAKSIRLDEDIRFIYKVRRLDTNEDS